MDIKKIPSAISGFPKTVPAEVMDWFLKEKLNKTYLFYSPDTRIAKCTKCEGESNIDDLIIKYKTRMLHNAETICPHCLNTAILKSKNKGSYNLKEQQMFIYFQKYKKSVYGIMYYADVNFFPGNVRVDLSVRAVYKINKSKSIAYWRSTYFGFNCEYWTQMKNTRIPFPPGGLYWTYRDFSFCDLYRDNLQEVIFDNPLFTHTGAKEFYDLLGIEFDGNYSEGDIERFVKYLYLNRQYPIFEKLCKAGFAQLVVDKLNSVPASRAINWKAENLKEAFGVTKNHIKVIRESELNLSLTYIYLRQIKDKNPITVSELKRLWGYLNYKTLHNYTEEKNIVNKAGLKMSKVLAYVEFNNNGARYTGDPDLTIKLSDYTDYLNECMLLGYSLKDKSIAFPKDFHHAHEKSSQIAAKIQVGVDDEKIYSYALSALGADEYKGKDFMIVAPKSTKDITREGSRLGHCVGTYAKRMSEGKTIILFVRNISEPDKPFFTLEINKKYQLQQCRGQSNRSMPDDVKRFVNRWLNSKTKNNTKVNKKSKVA